MKTSADPRHIKRREIVKSLFAESYTEQPESDEAVLKILSQRQNIDEKIHEAAPTWPLDKLNKIDLAILRLAIFELNEKIAPPKVIIDEAVEIAKEFGSESSPSFINGVLGTIYKAKNEEDKI